jgi:hypothetical protein
MFDWDKDGLKMQPAPITDGITTQPFLHRQYLSQTCVTFVSVDQERDQGVLKGRIYVVGVIQRCEKARDISRHTTNKPRNDHGELTRW